VTHAVNCLPSSLLSSRCHKLLPAPALSEEECDTQVRRLLAHVLPLSDTVASAGSNGRVGGALWRRRCATNLLRSVASTSLRCSTTDLRTTTSNKKAAHFKAASPHNLLNMSHMRDEGFGVRCKTVAVQAH
jgi:hypothetical protein